MFVQGQDLQHCSKGSQVPGPGLSQLVIPLRAHREFEELLVEGGRLLSSVLTVIAFNSDAVHGWMGAAVAFPENYDSQRTRTSGGQ